MVLDVAGVRCNARIHTIVATDTRTLQATLPPIPPNLNHIGSVAAPSLWALAELPGGIIFMSSFDTEKFVPVILESRMKFSKIAQGAITAEVHLSEGEIDAIASKAAEKGRAVYKWTSELKDSSGDTVALYDNVYMMMKNPMAKL